MSGTLQDVLQKLGNDDTDDANAIGVRLLTM